MVNRKCIITLLLIFSLLPRSFSDDKDFEVFSYYTSMRVTMDTEVYKPVCFTIKIPIRKNAEVNYSPYFGFYYANNQALFIKTNTFKKWDLKDTILYQPSREQIESFLEYGFSGSALLERKLNEALEQALKNNRQLHNVLLVKSNCQILLLNIRNRSLKKFIDAGMSLQIR
jgi:hypothetical protein